MSEYNIPFHIQEEIMKRLPVKSLVKFRSISKAWKSIIDSSHFIAAHTLHCHTQPQHLLVGYENKRFEVDYVSFVDDETLFRQMPVPTYPLFAKQLAYANIVGISHGLVCLYWPDINLIVIWNPSIRKLKTIDVDVRGLPIVGFGVCPMTTDPKIVAIKQSWDESNIESSYSCKVMVYTLSSGEWRSLSANLPTKPLRDSNWHRAVTTDGFINWLGGLPGQYMIISFDVTNENFKLIDLLDSLARHDLNGLNTCKIRGSLGILQFHKNINTYTVWMMEAGVQRSFRKLFTIQAGEEFIKGFRKSGAPIVEDDVHFKLVVYEPNLEHSNALQIPGVLAFFKVHSYMETLFLLGRSDCSNH